MVINVLVFAFLLSTVKAIDPQKAVNMTELLVRLHSLETNFANLSQTVSVVSNELKTERVARQGLEQELNRTKISHDQALQEIQMLNNTSNDMKQSLLFMNNVTTTLFHQMAISLSGTQDLQSTLNITQTDIRAELGQTQSECNKTYGNVLQKMNSLIQNTEAKMRSNIAALGIDLHKELDQTGSTWNNTYEDILQKMKYIELKLQSNLTTINAETNKMFQQQTVSMSQIKDAVRGINLTMTNFGLYSFIRID